MALNWLLSRNTKNKHVGVALKARKHAKESNNERWTDTSHQVA